MRPYLLCAGRLAGYEALDPTFPNGEAAYLYSATHAACGISEADWRARFQRNALVGDVDAFPPDRWLVAAKHQTARLVPLLRERVLVLIGAPVALAMRHNLREFEWAHDRAWVMVPQGIDIAQNPVAHAATGCLLADLLIDHGYKGQGA